MFNSVEFIRDVCKSRKIPVSQLEKECNFANGYLNPKKLSKIPYERAIKIASYLNLSVELIMTGKTNEPTPETGSGQMIGNKAPEVTELTSGEKSFLFKFRQLNLSGQEKVIDYIDDLLRAGIYKNQPSDSIQKRA